MSKRVNCPVDFSLVLYRAGSSGTSLFTWSFFNLFTILASRTGLIFSSLIVMHGQSRSADLWSPTIWAIANTAWLMRQTPEITSLRSFLLSRDLKLLLTLSWKVFWTTAIEWSSSKWYLQRGNAMLGLSAFSNIVAKTRYSMANIRTVGRKALLLTASVAFLRASLNLFFASDNAFCDNLSGSVSSVLFIPSGDEIEFWRTVVSTPTSLLFAFSSISMASSVVDFSKTTYISTIPSLKKLMLAPRSFQAMASNFELTASISRTIQSRNFSSVTSPSLSFSANRSRPLLIRKPIVALKTLFNIIPAISSSETIEVCTKRLKFPFGTSRYWNS